MSALQSVSFLCFHMQKNRKSTLTKVSFVAKGSNILKASLDICGYDFDTSHQNSSDKVSGFS